MPTLSLTKRAIDGILPDGSEQFYWDPELKGFGLKLSKQGTKSYIIQYRMGGRGSRTRRYTLGQHGSPWTPASARAEAEKLLQDVRKGIDVLHACVNSIGTLHLFRLGVPVGFTPTERR